MAGWCIGVPPASPLDFITARIFLLVSFAYHSLMILRNGGKVAVLLVCAVYAIVNEKSWIWKTILLYVLQKDFLLR